MFSPHSQKNIFFHLKEYNCSLQEGLYIVCGKMYDFTGMLCLRNIGIISTGLGKNITIGLIQFQKTLLQFTY